MKLHVENLIEFLSRTPVVLRSLLNNLPEEFARSTEGAGTGSPFDVVGHLAHGEKTDWIPRVKRILESGTTRAFEPFDREAMFTESKGKSLESLLDEFEDLRKRSVAALQNLKLSERDFSRTGLHPALGEVTLGQLLSTWVVHDMDHLTQIVRTLAKQYSVATGPWKEYLSVLSDRTTE
jgi:uncharacterized damage-inducible protein DinB